ncbi:TIGR02391 family protein [Candidatus Atribacteria bacterium HGW-Atribacteria-1]|nr:MAG: TIGR02391 family protein [Candidatus Atribacteria bacterium HGW-Atribacteria-1]
MDLNDIVSEDIYSVIKNKYDNQLYSDAILDSIKYLTNIIREKSKVDGDGVGLIGQAFGGQSPKIKINKMVTTSEIDEQKGYEQILRGIYCGIRNPRSHEQYQDVKEVADSIIIFINYLAEMIKSTKSYFQLEEYKNRVFDPLFVEREDYAEMLVNEIPSDEIVNTSISILKDRNRGESKKLETYFKALFNKMDRSQYDSLMKAISNELKIAQQNNDIISIVRLIEPKFWPILDDDVKIRIENVIIESVREGYYDMYEGIKKGHLGTWAGDIGGYFKLRRELGEAIIEQLNNNWYAQNYIAEYFIYYLSSIIIDNDLIRRCCNNISYATLSNNAKHLKKLLKDNFSFFPTQWQELILKYGLKYKEYDIEYFESLRKLNAEDNLPF